MHCFLFLAHSLHLACMKNFQRIYKSNLIAAKPRQTLVKSQVPNHHELATAVGV